MRQSGDIHAVNMRTGVMGGYMELGVVPVILVSRYHSTDVLMIS